MNFVLYHTGMLQMIDVTMWSQQLDAFARFVKEKLIHSHPNRHPICQSNCKSIIVMPMNMKEFDNFFGDRLAFFVQKPNFVQNCEFRFFVQNAKFRHFVRFSSKTNFLSLIIVSLHTQQNATTRLWLLTGYM